MIRPHKMINGPENDCASQPELQPCQKMKAVSLSTLKAYFFKSLNINIDNIENKKAFLMCKMCDFFTGKKAERHFTPPSPGSRQLSSHYANLAASVNQVKI